MKRLIVVLACLGAVAGARAAGLDDDLYRSRRFSELRQDIAGRSDAEATFYAGMLALEEERSADKAIALLERAVEAAPAVSTYHLGLSEALAFKLVQSGLFGSIRAGLRVREEMRRAVELDPDSAEARVALALYYLRAPAIASGSHARAREEAAAATRLNPSLGATVTARIEEDEGRFAEAEPLFRRGVDTAGTPPEQGEALNRLALFLSHRGRHAEAVATAAQATQVQPDNPDLFDTLGEIQLAAGDAPAAIQSYQQALHLNARFESSLLGLARAYDRQARRDPAVHYYRRFLEQVPEGRRADEARDALERLTGRAS